MATKIQPSFRCDQQTLDNLNALCATTGKGKSEIIRDLINAAHKESTK